MDTLNILLAGLQQESIVFCQADLRLPWGFAKDQLQGAPFHVVTEGKAWVRLENETCLYALEAGDFIVLPQGDAHFLMGEPNATTISFTEVLKERGAELWQPKSRFGPPIRFSYGGDGLRTLIVSGVFAFADSPRNPLITTLPRVIYIQKQSNPTDLWLDITLQHLAAEATSELLGAAVITAKLADILFIEAIRTYLATQVPNSNGWLSGWADPQISVALGLIHGQPNQAWTVGSFAERLGMSRSSFATRFKTLVGQGPIEYLTKWRMHEAAKRLLAGTSSLEEIAQSVGYSSEVAFAKAFKRAAGQAPAAYRASNGVS